MCAGGCCNIMQYITAMIPCPYPLIHPPPPHCGRAADQQNYVPSAVLSGSCVWHHTSIRQQQQCPHRRHHSHNIAHSTLYTRGAVARLATATANLPGGCPILNTSTCTRQQYYCREEEFNTKILLSCIKPFCRKATLKTTNWIQSALRDSCEVVLFTVQ